MNKENRSFIFHLFFMIYILYKIEVLVQNVYATSEVSSIDWVLLLVVSVALLFVSTKLQKLID